MKILPASEVRDKFASVIEEISKDKEPVFVTQYGKAKAVVLDVEMYNALVEMLEDLEDISDFRNAEGEATVDFEKFIKEFEGKKRASA